MRRKYLLIFLASILMVGFHAASQSAPEDPVRSVTGDLKFVITEQGQYKSLGEVLDLAAPNTASGKIGEHRGIRLIRSGASIPAKKGVIFGFRYRVEGQRDGPMMGAQMHVMHPPMRGVDGKLHSSQTASIDLFFENGVAEDDIVYVLSEDFEVLPGVWTLQILFDGKPAASRSFELR